MRLARSFQDRIFLLALALIGLVFVASLLTPVEFAVWAFYLAPIFMVYVWGKPTSLFPTIGIVSGLVLLSLLPAWENEALPVVTINRILGVAAIWILGHYLYKQRRTNDTQLVNLTKYAVLFDTAPVGISIIDAAGNIVEANPQASQMLGISRDEQEQRALNDPVWKVLRPDGTPMPPEEFPGNRALREGRHIAAVEMGIARPDGTTAWINTTAAPLPLTDYGVVTVYSDITSLRAAQEALRRSEERLRYALAAVSDGAWDWDIRSGEVTYSEGWLEKLGYTPAEAYAHINFWESLVHPDDLPRVRQALADHFSGHTPVYECENRLRAKSGEYRYNLDRGRVVEWDAEGRPLRMVGADTDITERMQHAAMLAQLAAIVESSDDAILGIDPAGIITSWNRGAAHLYGYTAAEAVGCAAEMLFAADRRAEAAAVFASVSRGEVIRHYATEHVARDGRRMDVALTVSPVHGPAGPAASPDTEGAATIVAGISIIARDVTEQRALERAVLELNAELEARVAARTAELAAALAGLREADQLKEAFLAAISHELRTPLTGVLGVAEALELQVSGPLNPRQLEHVRLLRRSGARLLEMINSILHYTNLLAGETTVRRQPCSLAGVAAAAIRKVQTQAELKQIAIDFAIELPDLRIDADVEGLTQLLCNLLDNAVKFTPHGGSVGLRIAAAAGQDGVGQDGKTIAPAIQCVVWDTGIGISEPAQTRIFDPFIQAEGGLARRYEGIGLGLAYARRMVGLLGGNIAVESVPGQGSRFIVTLPATAPEPRRLFIHSNPHNV